MLTDLQVRKISKLFAYEDRDSDGFLERHDFAAIADALAAMRGWQSGSDDARRVHTQFDQVWATLAQHADANRDGKVSLDEWLAFHDQTLSSPEGYEALVNGTAELVLSTVDLDGDGAMSKSEWGAFFAAYGVDSGELDTAYDRLDMRGDGAIDREEIVLLVREFFTSDDPDARGNWLIGSY